MIRVNLITVGKLKEKYWRDECRLPDSPSDKEIQSALESEAAAMQKYLDVNGAYNIAMCIEGKQLTSEELSAAMTDCGTRGYSTLNFIIGSSFGIAPAVKQRADMKLSMSKMTFPHQLARILLLEQIYRGFQIEKGSKYHK